MHGNFDPTNPLDIVTFLIAFCQKSEQARRVPKDYGVEKLIYSSEIHLIRLIEEHPNHNLTELATLLDVSKMSVSAQTRKLEKKGLLIRIKNANKKEVVYEPTLLSKNALQNHLKYHEQEKTIIEKLMGKYSAREIQLVFDFLSDYMNDIDSYIFDKTRL